MQTHYIKLNQNFAEAIRCGDKTFEIRKNDRGYQKGDRVIFQAVNNEGLTVSDPINREVYEISYLLHGWGLQDGFCVFSIRLYKGEEDE